MPGHGPLSNQAELVVYCNMLLAIRGRTEAAIALDLSLDEFLVLDPGKEFDETWGSGFLSPDPFLTIVYTDLSNRQ